MLLILIVLATIITTVTVTSRSKTRQASKQLSLGERYLSELEYEKAIIAFNKVIQIEPSNMQAYLGLAEAYEELGQKDRAVRTLEKAIIIIEDEEEDIGNILSSSEEIYLELSRLYEQNGEIEKAYRILKEGYELLGTNKLLFNKVQS